METARSYSFSEGLVVGLIGYAAVALVVAGVDVGSGRALFHTPATLGRGFVADPGPVGIIGASAVLPYNAVHLFVFLLIGIGVVQLARFVELHPMAWYIAFFLCVLGFFIAELAFTVLDPEETALSWWSIVLPTAAAAFTMGLYVNLRHPRLWRRIEGLADSRGGGPAP